MTPKFTIHQTVLTEFGQAKIVGIDLETHTYPRYQLDFNNAKIFPFHAWFDEMDLQKVNEYQLTLF